MTTPVKRRRRQRDPSNLVIWLLRLGVVVLTLAAWQFLPKLGALRDFSVIFDPFFVSSPEMVYHRLLDMGLGRKGQTAMWTELWTTIKATLLGVGIGVGLGLLFGLVFSNSRTLQRVMRPFIALLNSMPRIALVPIFVIIAGPTTTASVLTAVVVVFFIVFYNAFAGGVSVPPQTIQNAQLLGATSWELMRSVRLPYVMVWTFTALPNALSFGLVAVVTAEILTGRAGMGQLLLTSISTVDSTLTFSVVVVLSVVGVALVTVSDALQRRVLHWWDAG
jgi:NitT/TauT family transport system permease protein